ncbi:MAG TPA: hypothetical protein VLG27_04365 [Candidatus Saccharimonadia bacterium]|nr:hypothetical protein [Candidatus Saccharimonadia bacterium]
MAKSTKSRSKSKKPAVKRVSSQKNNRLSLIIVVALVAIVGVVVTINSLAAAATFRWTVSAQYFDKHGKGPYQTSLPVWLDYTLNGRRYSTSKKTASPTDAVYNINQAAKQIKAYGNYNKCLVPEVSQSGRHFTVAFVAKC